MKIAFFFCFSCLSFGLFGQDLELISTSGGYDEGSNGSVSWSIGEPIIQTFEGTSIQITQGFHQSGIYVLAVENFHEIGISIYPNPTSNYINVKSKIPVNVTIFDSSGRLVRNVELISTDNQIDLSELSRGTYNLIFESNGELVKTAKIIKQ